MSGPAPDPNVGLFKPTDLSFLNSTQIKSMVDTFYKEHLKRKQQTQEPKYKSRSRSHAKIKRTKISSDDNFVEAINVTSDTDDEHDNDSDVDTNFSLQRRMYDAIGTCYFKLELYIYIHTRYMYTYVVV
jgi:hypothetical protein